MNELLYPIIGDVIGSSYELHSTKRLDFPLYTNGSRFTDDTVIICATADWLLHTNHTQKELAILLKDYCNRHIAAGYGRQFLQWIQSDSLEPYQSIGNGAAIRGIPIGYYAGNLSECLELAETAACVTHDSAEGITSTQAVAATIWLKRHGKTKYEIIQYLKDYFNYDINNCDPAKIRDTYEFSALAEESVPEAIACALVSTDAKMAIRQAVSLGGDADTQACIASGIVHQGIDYQELYEIYSKYLTPDLQDIVEEFNSYV